MEVSWPIANHFMQRAAVHILVNAVCCSKIKRNGEPDGPPIGEQDACQAAASSEGTVSESDEPDGRRGRGRDRASAV